MQNKYIKLSINISLIIISLVLNKPTLSYAQEIIQDNNISTSSGALSASPTLPVIDASPTPSPSFLPDVAVINTPPVSQTIPTLAPLGNLENKDSVSAIFKKPLTVPNLPKQNYSVAEKIQTRITNGALSKINTQLKYNGKIIPYNIDRKIDGDDLLLTLNSPNVYKPGKYSLEITDSDGISTVRNFDWGNININFDKSVYTVGDRAVFGITVTDGHGLPVCDANITINIFSPPRKQ